MTNDDGRSSPSIEVVTRKKQIVLERRLSREESISPAKDTNENEELSRQSSLHMKDSNDLRTNETAHIPMEEERLPDVVTEEEILGGESWF